MVFSDFTLKAVKTRLNLEIVENQSLFADTPESPASDYLTATLKRNVPLALAINTEKARSELIIINLLLELKDKLPDKISLFSGIDFNVDKERGLAGYCDYIIGGSPEQLYLDYPVIAIVEAKNENIISGLGQCIAEMLAARIFNEQEGHQLPTIYGAVTTGDEWKFLKLVGGTVFIDRDTYYLATPGKILGILVGMGEMRV